MKGIWRASFYPLLLATWFVATPASAQFAEDYLHHATSSAATHLFPINPATHRLAPLEGGAFLVRHSKTSEIDQSENGGDKLTTERQDQLIGLGTMADLGAGAGIGFTHQIRYAKTESYSSLSTRNRREEFNKQTQSGLKLLVELTEQIKAGMVIRYLYTDSTIIGDYFTSARTPIKTTLVGYGSGASVNLAKGAINYSYYPPLRGKAEILGEEKIIVESGKIVAGGHYGPNEKFTIGISVRQFLPELDDRADGTTANDDNQTPISLYGLDVDQYLFPQRTLLLGADIKASPKASFVVSLGQEQATFNFQDLRRFNRVTVRQGNNDNPQMKSYVLRGMLRFANQKLVFNAGLNMVTREYDFPASMNEGSYTSNERDLFVMVGASL